MKRILLGSALSTLLTLLWGLVYWNSPIPYLAMNRLDEDSEEVLENLKSELRDSGVYMIPSPFLERSERNGRGPELIAFVNREGMPVKWWSSLGETLLMNAVVSLMIGASLWCARKGVRTYRDAMVLVLWLAGAAAVLPSAGSLVWWGYPLAWCVVESIYGFVAWLLAGMVLAAFLERNAEQGEV